MADERDRRRPVTAKEASQNANEVTTGRLAASRFLVSVDRGESADYLIGEAREVDGRGVALRPKLTPAAKPAASGSGLRALDLNEPGCGGNDRAGELRRA